jgi:5,10-methylene-tetrahydrofolate dehydrogenase/methenyl tetrahydrofolate cyclohydrolase
MDRRVGLTPVPDNANVEAFLQSVAEDHDQELFHVLVDMKATIEQTQRPVNLPSLPTGNFSTSLLAIS